jgi:hypothetical protein
LLALDQDTATGFRHRQALNFGRRFAIGHGG